MEDIISKLRAKNISIDVLNNQIKLKIPEGLECEALLDEVNNNSADLISFIERLKNVNSSLLEQDHMAKQKSFWISAYQDLPEALDLPLDYVRSKQTEDQYESHSFELDEQTTSSIRRLGETNGATIFTVLLAAYTILLSRLSSREDVVVGVPASSRRHAGPEGIIGAFINMLALRNYPSGQLVFRDFLAEVNLSTASFFDHQDFQYEDLIDELNLPLDTGRNPLFEAAFSYQNFETDSSSIPELDLSFYKQRGGTSKIDLSLFASVNSGCLYLNLVYPAALFSESAISRFGAYFLRIINAVTIDYDIRIADIDILSDNEKYQLLNQDNSRASYPEERTVVNCFEEQVLLHPDRIALVDQEVELSYRVLDSLSNRLARALRAEGVGRDSIVGLLTGRTQETVIGMLGILKAGGAYLPMDLDYPQDRINYMLEDSKAFLLLVTAIDHNEVYPVKTLIVQELINQDSISGEAVEPVNSAEDLCYVIYTSGTTGYPKGVLVEHRNVVRLFFHDSPLFDFGASDVWTMFHNPYFDFSVWEIYGALLYGGKLVIVPKMIARDPVAYLELLVSHGVTILNQTPSAFYNLDEAESLSGLSSGALKLRYIIFGGEALKPLKLAGWYEKYPDIKLVNMFGITETTVHVTYKLIGDQEIRENVSNIGIAIPTLSTYIFDRYQRLVPQGVTGELYVGGAGVSRGYLNRAELTETRFIQNPYNLEERLYRTGDLCRQQTNGELEYIGRIDHQVKIRGYRIELGEIESRLLEHKKVSDALVIVKEDDIDKYLIGYYVAEKAISVSVIREYLQNLLPEYMLPSYYVHLLAFPLTANGKVDRRALPEVVLATENEYEAPSSKMEHILVGIWSEILKMDHDKISVNSSFFDLGGHSLKAMILINRIWKKTGTEVSLKTIFSHQDIRSLSAYILEMAFGPVYTAIPLAVEKAHYVLSSAQKRLYFLYEFDRDSLAYNMPRAAWLSGELNQERLTSAFEALIRRHEMLRSTIVMIGDEPFQVIGDGSNFSTTVYQAQREEVAGIMESFIRPFDLGQGPLLRVGLVHVPGGDSLLMVDMHHIIADEASQEILIRDFIALYAGEDLPAPGLQYKEYAEWQQSTAEQDRMAKQKSFWLSEYQDLPETLDLPLDYTRPKQAGNQSKSYNFELDEQTTASLRYLGEQHGTTLYTVLLSVYTILLGRLSRSEDVVVGTPIAGRRHADLDGMIGMFVNTLALRNFPLGELVFQDFLAEVSSRTLSCFDHQDFQYEDLIDELNLPRNPGHNPLIEVMFSYENFEREELVIPDLILNPYQQQEKASLEFDLTLAAIEDSGKLDLSFTYSAELFKETTISRFAIYFKHIAGQVLAAPGIRLSEIGLLVSAERSRLLELGTGAIPAYATGQTIVQLFEAQVLQSPDAVALIFEDQALTYQELDERSDQLSLFLAGRGVVRGTVIGLLLERSPDMIIGILGILKAGGTYVPIDSGLPQERILYLLRDSGSEFLLSSSAYSDIYQEHIAVLNIAEAKTGGSLKGILLSEPEDLLYIIYTSGSSGKPKGVMVNNISLVNYIQSQLHLFKINSADRILQFSTISFDASVEQIWLALLSGAGLVLVTKEVITDQALFNTYLNDHQVTHLHATPSFLESISLSEPNNLRRIIAAGEVCRAELANRYLENYDFYNKYGPTEGTISCLIYPVKQKVSSGSRVPVGRPVAGTSVYILDQYQGLSPEGVAGELYVSGLGLARGYVNNGVLTAEKFVPNPFEPGSLMYRTGDLVRWTEEGNIDYLGRIDDQVKIRGYRIEPGEIEAVISGLEEINQALVLVKEQGDDKQLVAYYTAAEPVADLKQRLQDILPDYMLPSYYVHLAAFPLTANGKVDRRALPEVVLDKADNYEAPSSPLEHTLVGIWSEILKIDQDKIGVNRSFFDVGGHSLKAMIMVNRIWKKTGVEVSLKAVFSHQDIRSLSAYIGELVPGSVYSAIPLAVKKPHYVLSSAQKRLYFLYEFDRDSLAYNMPQASWLSGELDRERLAGAFQALIRRHEVLRTTIVMIGDEPFQVIGDGSNFSITDYQAQREEVAGVMESFIRPFDLEKGPLLRVGLVYVPEGESLLMVDMHHIITDGVSQGILIRDFMALYAGEDLPAPGLQYKDYAEWQQSVIAQDRIAEQRFFWLSEYEDLPEVLDLPLDYARPDHRNHRGDSYSFELDEQTTASLRYLGEQHGATLYAVLLSVYTILLGRLSRSEDVVVGTPIAGRRHADLDGMIGMFVNTLALRNYPVGELVFEDFLAGVSSRTLSCFDHQDFQYEDLVDELNLPRNLGRSPLIEVMFSYANFEHEELIIPGLTLSPYQQKGEMSSKFDLSLAAIEDSGKIYLSFGYSAELFKETTISRFATYFKHIVEQVLAAPGIRLSEIGLLVPAERSRLLELGTGAIPAYATNQTIVSLFEAQVLQSPDAVALVFEDQVLTYQELDERSDQLSLFLASHGVVRGTVIGLLLERSPDMIIGVLGILKAGGIYVPIDSGLPQERILYLLSDSGSGFLLTSSAYTELYQAHIPVLDIAEAKTGDSLKGTPVSKPEDLLYIIYTSGSSGKPKGVMVSNVSLVNYMQSQLNLFKIDNTDRILQFSTISFDASVEQIWLALLSGAGLVLVTKEVITDQALFNTYLHDHQVTHLHATPSFLESISLSEPNSLRRIIAAGEVCRAELANRYLENYDFYNKYGPTESTISCLIYPVKQKVSSGSGVPVGRPITGTSVYILDQYQGLSPEGVSGELYVSGLGLACGYVNNGVLTAEKFVPNPFEPGSLMYRTGDLVRWTEEGNIDYLGRIDDQVKIRGYRIEPGEIEVVISGLEEINQALVLVKEQGGDKQLVAYYTAAELIPVADLKQRLQDILPDYMLPSYYVHLSVFPLTVNGKIDRRALPEVILDIADSYQGASNLIEMKLLCIWSEILKIDEDKISVNRSFFDLGGHSLKAMSLVNRIRKELGREVSLKVVFSHQDIRSLSAYILEMAFGSDYNVIPLAAEKTHYVLSSAQKRLYFLYEFDRNSLAYNMPQAAWLSGELDRERLADAFQALIRRHEVFRTTIVMIEDEPFQVIGDGEGFSITDYQAQREEVTAVVESFIQPFDLGQGPLLRVGLVHVPEGESLLMVDMHHIITDGVSHGILIRDFMALYAGEDLSAPGLQYKDYAEWQQSAIEQDRMAKQRSFWLSEYQDLPEALDLPLDYVRPKQAEHQSGSYSFELDEQTTRSISRLGEENGATLFMVLLSVYTILLSRLGNREDVVVGIPTAGRRHADLEGVIGVFINMLALRNYPLRELSFQDFLAEVSSRTLSCFDQQDFQYEDLVDELKLPRNTGRNPLFEATFSYQNYESESLSIPGLTLSPYDDQEAGGISKFDLSLFASEHSGCLYLSLVYSTALFSESSISRFGDYFQHMIKAVVADPGIQLCKLDLLSSAERSRLLELGKGASASYTTEETVVDLFAQQALRYPDGTAIVFEDYVLTYRELDQLSNQLASRLQSSHQIAAGDAVGICLGRSGLMLVGILGILKAGGVYVPFDIDYPQERKNYICTDAGIRLLLTVTDHVFDVVDYYSGAILALDVELDLTADIDSYPRPVVPIHGESLAYISYTSGSTGNPKGVMVPHQAILRLLSLSDIILDKDTVTLQLSSVSFDAATFEIWAALLSGGKVVIGAEGTIDISRLNSLIKKEGVNTLWLTSGLLDQWAESDLSGLPLRYLLSGGDVVRASSVAKVYRQLAGVRIYNGYGPTENTTFTCCYQIPRDIQEDQAIPIGRPITGTDVYVLNSSGSLSPAGVAGELCVSGLGLANGYVNNAVLTAEKFVENPFERDSLMYRTGDLVRWSADGNLLFLGRIDNQVKIRGYRIEPGEIEVVISGLEEVNQALVVVKEQGGDKYLVAYYTAAEAIADLRQRLKGLLPDYMLPYYYVHLSAFPLTANGKVDRRALPEAILDIEDNYEAPSSALEHALAVIWSEILKIDQDKISVNRSFFDLGGHSLKALGLVNKIHKTFSVEFPISDVFSSPTIKLMAKIIEVQQWIDEGVEESSETIKIII